jgi:two-component system OmpR family response regulator
MADKYKILLVDDDKFLLDMYSIKFNEKGYAIETALGPEAALKKLADKYEPDAILLDVIMPGMDGFTLLDKIKKENLAPQAAVVILTNQGQDSDLQRARTLGADGYIVKASSIPSEVVEKAGTIIKEKKKKMS